MIDAIGVATMDRLEALESRLLVWGSIEGSFTSDEFRSTIEETIDDLDPGGATVSDVATWMQVHGLVVRVASSDGARRYRTRMGEAVRLMAQLRQLFPRHVRDLAWMTAPTLVADYRFALRPRRYPRRSITAADTVAALRDALQPGDPRPNAAAHLLAAIEAETPGQLRLARFQVDAAERVLRALEGNRSAGTIVSAGTGSGKTLAFYLPAFAHLCQLIEQDARPWTKAVAIYPRQELLADQFSEAYAQARRLDASLRARGVRALVLGAYFGKVPVKASDVLASVKKGGWRRHGDERECPFLRCPGCRSLMVWRGEDIDVGREVLHCPSPGCGHRTPDGALMLTRNSQQSSPPDILFTITESLNNQLGNRFQQAIFGVHARRPPQLVLLDEVHTYEGTHGAHVAMLLRRWQHAVRGPMHFVGLSATLRDATRFMSELTGLRLGDIVGIESPAADMVAEGREYLLALRGDPVSSASLLSTSLQTLMLLGRVLDPQEHATSGGLFGQRLFAFTDDLDVTNRMFDQLCDAEAVGRNGQPFRRQGGSLANLRAGTRDWLADDPEDQPERRTRGQLWDLCENIGHVLAPGHPLVIGRTSSQDPGVHDLASVIVATASLEVGFDDPRVGAVLQHKAPHDAARFLQRKGRAGRTRRMRPWTVVVLSDYGRDRLAYQGYDLLFDPELAPRHLAIRNRHVLRMQATFATMDWLSERLAQVLPRNKGRIMDDLGGPPQNDYARARHQALVVAIREVLTDGARRDGLATHLRKALAITENEVEAVLWEPPRAVMTAVLPTLLRRLESEFRSSPRGGAIGEDAVDKRQPAPEFVPRALFSDLNLPEVRVDLPPNQFGDEVDPEYLPISQALGELAPGRVTRRFGVEHSKDRHWLSPSGLDEDERYLAIDALFPEADPLDPVHAVVAGRERVLPCIRPRAIVAEQPPDDVRSSSYARMDWRSELLAPNGADELALVAPPSWRFARPRLSFHTASGGTALEVRRFSLGSRAEVAIERGQDLSLVRHFVRTGSADELEPVAVGFVLDADGLALTLELPDPLEAPGGVHADLPAARRAYLIHRIAIHPGLDGVANDFQRQWLAEIYLAAVLEHAISRSLPLEQAHDDLLSGDLAARLAAVMDTIFQTLPASEEEPGGEAQAGSTRQLLHDTLIDLFSVDEVRVALADVAQVLWTPPDEAWRPWALERCRATLAGAALEACQILCPEFDVEGLIVDLDAGPRATDPDRIYITETTIGGGGVVEEIGRRISEDPRRFFDLMRSRLGPSDFEVVDAELGRLLAELPRIPALAAALDGVRGAVDHVSTAAAQDALMRTLSEHDYFVCHPVMAALNARLLRPGATASTDDLLREARNRWIAWERDLEVEIDGRVAAYLLACDESLTLPVEPPADPARRRQWRSNVMSGLLWPRGGQLRASAMTLRSPYALLPAGDRMLVSSWLGDQGEMVELAAGWEAAARDVLTRDGVVIVQADGAHRATLATEGAAFVAEPVEIEHLHLYPRIAGLRRWRGRYELRLQLRHAPA